MSNFLNIPFLSPFRFVPNTTTPGIHFDDDFTFNRIKSFETKVQYYQKWKRGDSTPIQVSSTLPPSDLKVYDCYGVVKKSIPFVKVVDGLTLGYSIYEAVFNINELIDGIYYLYAKASFGGITFEAISEPVSLKDKHSNTLLFTYKNSFNDFGTVFTTGIEYKFRCEAGIMDFQPDRERASYIDQIHNVKTLSATPFRTYKLFIGEAPGVSPYILDILNRIFSCDYVLIAGKQYETTEGSKWEVNRVKGYPLYGGSIEILEAVNQSSLQINDVGNVPVGGLVASYEIDTNFFGNADTIHITDIETN